MSTSRSPSPSLPEVPLTLTESLELRVHRSLLRRNPHGVTPLVVDDHAIVELQPTDEIYHKWVGPDLYTATVRGWHRGQDVAAGMTPEQAMRRALGLED